MNNKQEFMIKLFCIIVLLILITLVILNGLKLDCSKCKIHFQANKQAYTNAFNSPLQDYYINISLLYSSYLNNECYIEWDADNQGFRINDKQIEQYF